MAWNTRLRPGEAVLLTCPCGNACRIEVEEIRHGDRASATVPARLTSVNLLLHDVAGRFRYTFEKRRDGRPPEPPPHAHLAFGASVVAAKRPGSGAGKDVEAGATTDDLTSS